jgi:hypothetical protein
MVEPIASAADMPGADGATDAGRAGGLLTTWIATVIVSAPAPAGLTGGGFGPGGAGGAGGPGGTGGAAARVSASGCGASGRSTQ